MQLTTSVEDYLKTIWKLGSRGERVTATAIAARREVSGPSASVMLRRLIEAGFVVRGQHAEVVLTRRGESEALRVVRRHRLLETFLVDICGLTWDEVDDEAEVLEHVLSPRLEGRIDELLGYPTRDPHGDPIPPPRATEHADDWSDPLREAAEDSTFLIERVSDRHREALRFLGELGVRPGVVLRVGRREPFGGPLWVTVGDGDEPAGLPPQLVDLIHGQVTRPAGATP